MKITLKLKLVLHNSEEERQIAPGTTVQKFIDGFLPGCAPQARRMLVDKQGVFRGVVLLNKSRADMQKILSEGDELIFLSIVSGG
jgi:molybdopterin converting factor small subunit